MRDKTHSVDSIQKRKTSWLYQNRIIRNLLLALFVGMVIHTSQSQEMEQEDLKIEFEKISERLDKLEKDVIPRLNELEKQFATVFAEKKLDTEAKNAYNEINALVVRSKFDEAKAKVADFMKTFGATKYARGVARFQKELEVIGKETPKEWGIEKWFQGQNEIDLNAGSTTVLVFWETWCPHCVREVPKLQKLYKDNKENGLQLVGLTKLSKSATEEKLTAFISEKNVEYPIAKEDGSISQYFNVSGVPAAAVVRDGKVVWRGHPARLGEKLIQSWL